MANVTLKAKLVLRNDTESNWIKANPVLIKVEMGYGAGQVDPGTGKVKKRKKWRGTCLFTQN